MSTAHTKAARLHVGGHNLAVPFSRHWSLLGALIAALALLALMSAAIFIARDFAAGSASSTAPLSVELASPRVPARPVDALERIDLSTVVANTSDRPVQYVSLELNVLQSDGTSVLSARQSGLSLEAHDSRAVYWSWRVPGNLATGEYMVKVTAFDAQGRPLSDDQPVSPLRIVGRTQ